jgi:hypothetical protein
MFYKKIAPQTSRKHIRVRQPGVNLISSKPSRFLIQPQIRGEAGLTLWTSWTRTKAEEWRLQSIVEINEYFSAELVVPGVASTLIVQLVSMHREVQSQVIGSGGNGYKYRPQRHGVDHFHISNFTSTDLLLFPDYKVP